MPRPTPPWHHAVQDLYAKGWKMADIARLFEKQHAEIWWIVHKEYRRDHDKMMYELRRSDPERMARYKEAQAKHYAKVKNDPERLERRRAQQRKVAKKASEKRKAYMVEYRKKNREKYLEYARVYRVKKKGVQNEVG